MPAFLIAAWPWIKNALPYAAAIALVLAAYWWADDRGRAAQKAKDDKAVAAITQQRDSWISAFHASDANFRVAIGVVDQQNTESLARARAYDVSKAEDAQDVAAANAAWEKSEASRKALADIALNGKSGCKPSAALIDAIGDL